MAIWRRSKRTRKRSRSDRPWHSSDGAGDTPFWRLPRRRLAVGGLVVLVPALLAVGIVIRNQQTRKRPSETSEATASGSTRPEVFSSDEEFSLPTSHNPTKVASLSSVPHELPTGQPIPLGQPASHLSLPETQGPALLPAGPLPSRSASVPGGTDTSTVLFANHAGQPTGLGPEGAAPSVRPVVWLTGFIEEVTD